LTIIEKSMILSIKSNNRYVIEITKIEVFVQTYGTPGGPKIDVLGDPKYPLPPEPPKRGGWR